MYRCLTVLALWAARAYHSYAGERTKWFSVSEIKHYLKQIEKNFFEILRVRISLFFLLAKAHLSSLMCDKA